MKMIAYAKTDYHKNTITIAVRIKDKKKMVLIWSCSATSQAMLITSGSAAPGIWILKNILIQKKRK